MGLLSFLRRLFFGAPPERPVKGPPSRPDRTKPPDRGAGSSEPSLAAPIEGSASAAGRSAAGATAVAHRTTARLAPLRYEAQETAAKVATIAMASESRLSSGS